MGCEDFVVRLSSALTPEAAAHALLAIAEIHSDTFPTVAGLSHYRYDDPDHIIELELLGGPRSTVSLRFSVCQPATIDDVFAALVVDLATKLTADILIAEDVEPDDPSLGWSFSPTQLGSFRKSLAQCIPKKRRQWQVDFGTVVARVSCREAIDRFVIGSRSARP